MEYAPTNKGLINYLYVKELVKFDELQKALDLLTKLDQSMGIDIENEIIMQNSKFRSNERERDIIAADSYDRAKAQIKHAILRLVDDVPNKLRIRAIVSGSPGAINQESVDHLEKIIGSKSTLVPTVWLEKALAVSKSVGRINLPSGGYGTGFIVADGYVFTNNHVLPNADVAAKATIEFNYEEDVTGNPKKSFAYGFDATTFVTNKELDFARVKLVAKPGAPPLDKWGQLEIDEWGAPEPGDPVNIIQHPKGGMKQIAITHNDVISSFPPRLLYTADTEPGSSGSPVFNQDWKVVAIHHAGKLLEEGGITINKEGERASANRGILFSAILEELNK